MLAINARGLQRRFGDAMAVDGLDPTGDRGEVYGFLGPLAAITAVGAVSFSRAGAALRTRVRRP